MGKGRSLNWQAKLGVNGNIPVCTTIRQKEGSIGYIGTEYASMFGLSTALIRNASGNYIKANSGSIRAAAETDYSDDMRIIITNSPNKDAYPLSCYSWFLVHKNQAKAHRSEKKHKALKDFLLFSIGSEQQKLAGAMSYVPLPEVIAERAKKQIESMEWNNNEK
jgi:ABC-type phosphate transport system, periplasmic component